MGSWLLTGELKSFEKPCAVYDFFRTCNVYANFLLTRALITHTNYVVVVGSRGWDRQFQTKGSGLILHNINVFMLKLYGSLWSSPRVLVLWLSLCPLWSLISLSLPVLFALTGFCFHELWPAAPLCGLSSECLLCAYPARICFWLPPPSLQTSG